MNTIHYNNYGCSPVQSESCAQIHGGGIIKAIGHLFGYMSKCYTVAYENSPELYMYSLMH